MLFIRPIVSAGSSTFGLELLHPTVQTQHRRLADRDVQVARPLLDLGREQLVD